MARYRDSPGVECEKTSIRGSGDQPRIDRETSGAIAFDAVLVALNEENAHAIAVLTGRPRAGRLGPSRAQVVRPDGGAGASKATRSSSGTDHFALFSKRYHDSDEQQQDRHC